MTSGERDEELRLDHVLIGVADLEHGIESLTRVTGVQPVLGGSHPELGTHNALLSLGPELYFELIAIRPEEDAPALGGLREHVEPTPVGWVVATRNRERTAGRLRAAGLKPGAFQQGGRVRESGEQLSWHLFSIGESLLGTTPFFLEWGDGTPHPSQDSPPGCTLRQLSLFDPRAGALERLMSTLGLAVPVEESATGRIEVVLETPKGVVTFGGLE